MVCDGVDEMVESAWRTLIVAVTPAGTLTAAVRARFVELRPAIESGWEMVVLVGVLTERPAAEDAELRDVARWTAVRDAYVHAHGLTPGALASAFDAARTSWMKVDAAGWLARHRFYPGIAAWLARLIADGQLVYVLSTKSKPFLDALLEWQHVFLPGDHVIGRFEPRREKWDVLRRLAAADGIAPADVWFVEDRLATLLEMRRRAPDFPARMFLAEWGYVFRDRDPAAARAAGIPVLTLERATGPFDAWVAA